MRRGVWHQCGDKSQRLVREQLEQGVGVGAILSPRDLAQHKAAEYGSEYRRLGADVLLDQQFYIPDYSNNNLASYAISQHRAAISQLNQIGDAALATLSSDLESASRAIGVTGVLAPAVIYEAARADITQLNARLFDAARAVGNAIGLPTYATVVLGRSVTASQQTLLPVLSQVTALAPDGWYFAFEFEAERIPSDQAAVERAGKAILTLAATGLPVLHGYAGPLSLLSFGFGACAAATGHAQNTWRFTPERWQAPPGQGGGGDAPPRFFSSSLWGTIVYPDETAQLAPAVRTAVLTHSPFSVGIAQTPPQPWSRWDANKHLLYIIGSVAGQIAQETRARAAAHRAIEVLTNATALNGIIASTGLQLADATTRYQANWLAAIGNVLAENADDFDYLEMLP